MKFLKTYFWLVFGVFRGYLNKARTLAGIDFIIFKARYQTVTITNHTFYSVYDRNLVSLTFPIDGYFNSRYSI